MSRNFDTTFVFTLWPCLAGLTLFSVDISPGKMQEECLYFFVYCLFFFVVVVAILSSVDAELVIGYIITQPCIALTLVDVRLTICTYRNTDNQTQPFFELLVVAA